MNDEEKIIKIFTLEKEHEYLIPLIQETFDKENIGFRIKSKYDNSEDLYRHEQYHFNISEVYARKFRKALYNMMIDPIDKKGFNFLYNSYLIESFLNPSPQSHP